MLTRFFHLNLFKVTFVGVLLNVRVFVVSALDRRHFEHINDFLDGEQARSGGRTEAQDPKVGSGFPQQLDDLDVGMIAAGSMSADCLAILTIPTQPLTWTLRSPTSWICPESAWVSSIALFKQVFVSVSRTTAAKHACPKRTGAINQSILSANQVQMSLQSVSAWLSPRMPAFMPGIIDGGLEAQSCGRV